MSTFEKSPYKVVLLTVLVLSIFTIAIIEVVRYRDDIKGRKGEFYDKEGTVYHGEIYAEERRTRCERMKQMKKTTMQFYETKHSFGSVPVGRVVSHTFRYKNTGSFPLLICKADVSCGCTVPRFPDEPVAPGMDGELVVEFNTAGKSGFQQKNIIVHANSLPESVSISVEADVH